MKFMRIKSILFLFLIASNISMVAGRLTNNGSVSINLVMYNNYTAPANGKSARGRLNQEGVVITAGQNVNFIPGTTSVDIYYGNGNTTGIHSNINQNYDYTLSPSDTGWVLTQDIQ